MIRRIAISIVILLFSALTAAAATLQLSGDFVQGGLVLGRTDPGNRVELDGLAVPVGGDGRFLLGFGRDAGAKSRLAIIAPGGARQIRSLKISARVYREQRINGLPERKVTPAAEDLARIIADNKQIAAVRAKVTAVSYFGGGFKWPVKGPISGVFGSLRVLNGKPKNPHNGVDIAAARGSLIVAPADGVVVLARPDMFYTGKTLMIDHGLGLTSVYAHMSAILVKIGDVVKRGTPIGRVGKTGRVTGAHLHWGITLEKTHLDPQLLTGPMPKS